MHLSSANREAVMLRLRRYESLLTSNGISLEEAGSVSEKGSTARDTGDSEDGQAVGHGEDPGFVDQQVPRRARVLGNRPDSELGDELPDPGEAEECEFGDEEEAPTPGSLVFGPQCSLSTLAANRPSIQQTFRLWQTFLDNFNPLTKILHAPTTQQLISTAVAGANGPDANTEALLFAIYLCAVTTMTEQECMDQLGEPKMNLFNRYSHATKRALCNAQFLQSTDLVVLQALTLYLLASRQCIDDQSMWLLAGLAGRTAQVMGMHREQTLNKLPPFEAELRRRLWWQIILLDSQSASVSGTRLDATWVDTGDTKCPLNLSDSALSPYMREIPFEHQGPTEMLFCRVRFEVGECMKQVRKVERARKVSPSVPLAQAEQAIDSLEHKLDEHLFRRCDGSIPLHLLATGVGHSAICSMRLSVRQHLYVPAETKGVGKMSEAGRGELFQLALRILEYDNVAYSTKSLQPFLWYVTSNFPFQALIHVLTHLLHWAKGDEAEQGWASINQVYGDRPDLIGDTKKPVSVAIGNLILKAWEKTAGDNDLRLLATTYPVASDVVNKLRARGLQTTVSDDVTMTGGV
ncbi:hypothetical protein OQA88_10598 [Cercophora sp. LCS_1]